MKLYHGLSRSAFLFATKTNKTTHPVTASARNKVGQCACQLDQTDPHHGIPRWYYGLAIGGMGIAGAAGAGRAVYDLHSGKSQEKWRLMRCPAPRLPGPVNDALLIADHIGTHEAKKTLKDALRDYSIVVVGGEAGIGKLSNAIYCAQEILWPQGELNESDNRSLLVFDYFSKASYRDSLLKVAKDLGLPPSELDLDKINLEELRHIIFEELINRGDLSIIIHKRVKTWAHTEGLIAEIGRSYTAQFYGVRQKDIITTCDVDLVSSCLREKSDSPDIDSFGIIDISKTASIGDLGKQLPPNRVREINKGYGGDFLDAIDYNPRLRVELIPFLCHSKLTMRKITLLIKPSPTTSESKVKENVLKLVTQYLSQSEHAVLRLVCLDEEEVVCPQGWSQILTIREKFLAATRGGPDNNEEKNTTKFHDALEPLQTLNLIKFYQPIGKLKPTGKLFSRILTEQHPFLDRSFY